VSVSEICSLKYKNGFNNRTFLSTCFSLVLVLLESFMLHDLPFSGFLHSLSILMTLIQNLTNSTVFLNRRSSNMFIPVTRRVKGYTRFVGKYVTCRRKRFRHHKVYIFLIRITSRVDLAMSVCPDER